MNANRTVLNFSLPGWNFRAACEASLGVVNNFSQIAIDGFDRAPVYSSNKGIYMPEQCPPLDSDFPGTTCGGDSSSSCSMNSCSSITQSTTVSSEVASAALSSFAIVPHRPCHRRLKAQASVQES